MDRNNDMHFSKSKTRQLQKQEVRFLEQINLFEKWREWKEEVVEIEKAWRNGTGGAFIWL